MQRKTIEKVLRAKLKAWLSTITDEALRKQVEDNILVTGGCIASMFLQEQVNDYDVYMKDIDVAKKLAEYYTKPYQKRVHVLDGREKELYLRNIEINNNSGYALSARNLKEDQIKLWFNGNPGFKVTEEDKNEAALNSVGTPTPGMPWDDTEENLAKRSKYIPLFFSPNTISLSGGIQVVLRFHGDAKKIHSTFDFVHATNYFTFGEGLITNTDALECILSRTLKYQGSFYPLTSIIRVRKFLRRGYNISAGELLKIMYQISELNLNDFAVLEEQLIGVDVAYFDAILSVLRGKMKDNAEFKLNSEAFNKIVDAAFNAIDQHEDN